MTPGTTVLAFVLCALALPAAAQIHRWVDEQGRVHYGDRPLGATGTTMRVRAESATVPGDRAAQVAAATVATPARVEPPAKPPQAAAPATIDRALAVQQRGRAGAQQQQQQVATTTPNMQALVAQCKANRGVDCDTADGRRNLVRENTPITREEQARIAGLRARKANCPRGALGC